MSKRTKQNTRKSSNYKDRHHILWPQHDWNRGYAKQLRDHWYMVIPIPMNTLHRKIHHEISHIPVPRGFIAKQALEQLAMLERFGALHPYDNIEKRLMVIMALFECCEPETHAALKHQQNIVRKFYGVNPR